MNKQLPIFDKVEPGVYTPLNNQHKKMRKLIDLPQSTIKELKIQGRAKNLKLKPFIESVLNDIAHRKSYKPLKQKQ